LIYLAGFFLILNAVHGSWLSDVFTGLNEAVDDSTLKKVKKTVEVLGTNVKKVGKEVVKDFKEKSSMPNNDWVQITKDFLDEITFADILKENSDKHMNKLVSKWNKVKQGLNEIDDESKSTKEMLKMYKQIKKDLQALLPNGRYKQWKERIHNVAKKMKDAVKKHLKNIDIDILKTSVQKWMQPSFMENKENVEEEKQMVKDAVDAVNDKLKSEAEKVGKKIVPMIKMTESKKQTDAEEEIQSKVESWLQKKFTKPHHKSGQSKWEFLKTMPLNELKKKFKNVPFKQLKKKFKKMARMNKKLVVVNEPIKTAVKVITGGKVPLFLSQEDNEKLISLTPEEQQEYKLAEAKWEAKVFKETQKLVKEMNKKEKKQTNVAPTPMITGNEDWMYGDDDEDEDEQVNFQQTKPKLLNKKFADRLAKEELEWIALRKKMKTMMN